jgi:hypothetical protein
MKQVITGVIAFISVTFIIGIWLADNVNNEIKELEQTYKVNLGKKILIDKDSLTIIDYSTFNERYLLSNGKSINKSLFK